MKTLGLVVLMCVLTGNIVYAGTTYCNTWGNTTYCNNYDIPQNKQQDKSDEFNFNRSNNQSDND